MDKEYYQRYEPLFGAWYIKKTLGEGSYGKVFQIEREDFGVTYQSALKAITIPQNQSEIKSVMADGMDEASVTAYYENFVEEIVGEFVLMSKLKGTSNIVSYEDHRVIRHKDGIGWDILIRMELLVPLIDHLSTHPMRREDVIQLGIDLCRALELCERHNIIHRDIKPENIFISENGDYKLGDFGIARTLEQTSGMLSKKGTQSYMAPEIHREESYGANVDIYSLGIVMYRLLNENRTPFLPAYPAPITYSDRESAIKQRISGAPIPPPKNAYGRLAEIVLKACSFHPKDRYSSPKQMREDLEAVLYAENETFDLRNSDLPKEQISPPADIDISLYEEATEVLIPQTQSEPKEDLDTEYEKTTVMESPYVNGPTEQVPQETKKNIKIKWLLGVAAVILVVCIGAGIWSLLPKQQIIAVSDILNIPAELMISEGEAWQLDLKIEPSNASDKTVVYRSENPQIAEVDNNGVIEAVSAGETMVSVNCGEITKTIRITVSESIDGTELANQFWEAQGYLQSVLNSIEIEQGDVALETAILSELLAQYDIEAMPQQNPQTLAEYQAEYNSQIQPAVSNLKAAYVTAAELAQDRQNDIQTTEQSKPYSSSSESAASSAPKSTASVPPKASASPVPKPSASSPPNQSSAPVTEPAPLPSIDFLPQMDW